MNRYNIIVHFHLQELVSFVITCITKRQLINFKNLKLRKAYSFSMSFFEQRFHRVVKHCYKESTIHHVHFMNVLWEKGDEVLETDREQTDTDIAP